MFPQRPLLLLLFPPWLYAIWFRFQQPRSAGFDPNAAWLAGLERGQLGSWALFAWIFVCIGFGLRGLWRYRKEWPRLHQTIAGESALTFYLISWLGAMLWMGAFAGQPPLLQQAAYSTWMLLALVPLWRKLDWRPQRGWWIWGLAAYGLGLAFALLYGALLQPEPSANPAVDWLRQSSGWTRWGWLSQICLVAPIIEEAWYRSLLSSHWPPRLIASAALFAAVHADPTGVLPLFALGLSFAWARWGGGFPAAVLAHVLWNSTTAVMLLGA